jgi:uncharacterized protein YggT (Ycf19 family)
MDKPAFAIKNLLLVLYCEAANNLRSPLRRNIVKLGLIGLSNCLSIVCLIVVTHHNTPKGKRQFAFVALFSVSFLVISWLIVKLVESAV